MTDHIYLWYYDPTTQLVIAKSTITQPLCVTPDLDFDLNLMSKFQPHNAMFWFWRTDREDVNCLRCLAMLREMESDSDD